MRIAYFAGSMKPGMDGVTRVLYRLSEYLQHKQVSHVFFSAITPPENERTVPMYDVPSVQFPLYNDYRFPLPGTNQIEEHLADYRPDILHINSPCSLGLAAIKYGQRNNIPVVATYHTHFASYARYYRVKMLERFSWSYFRNLYNKCEKVYVPSMPILEELRDHRLTNLEFIPHGVDTSLFHPRHQDETWKRRVGVEGKQVLLFVARLVWEKDLKTLAATYQLLKERRSDVAFVICGDGPARKDLEKLMPDAKFLGNQSGIDLSAAYASSDVFVFPSTTETFGNVTLEAMSSGLPPVCGNKGGAAGFVKSGITGFLANPRDAEDTALKIESLLDNPELRAEMSKQAFLYGQEQTWERSLEKMLLSYDDVVRTYSSKKTTTMNIGKPRRRISQLILQH
ncbi:MAG: glycosyltransferase family 1 protein [bacterium]